MSKTLGEPLASAIAAKDHAAVRELLHPELDFRAMTPNRIWEATDADAVISALELWFGATDEITGIDLMETDAFADRERVGYRLRVTNTDGEHLVEQQAYLSPLDGRIGWLRIMCAGYRPVG